MTNEEIAKKFLFEVEMGLFGKYNDSIKIMGKSKEIDKVEKILVENGYSKNEPITNLYYLFEFDTYSILTLSTELKKYYRTYLKNVKYLESYMSYNHLPDYIKDYVLWLIMRKLKRNFYLI